MLLNNLYYFLFFIDKIFYFFSSNFFFLSRKKNLKFKKKFFFFNFFNFRNTFSGHSFLNNYSKEKINFSINKLSSNKIFTTVEDLYRFNDGYPFTNFKKILFRFIKMIFFFNYTLPSFYTKHAHFYNFFFLKNNNQTLTIFNAYKLLKRWENSYLLIFNIFYYNYNPLVFSNPLFKNFTLPLNWFINKWDIKIWKYYFSFFIYRTNRYSTKVDFFYQKLKEHNFEFFLITDSLYHFKNLYYFKKHFFFTVGIVTANTNPWILDYPIFSFIDSYLIQLFFIKLIFYINKQILFFKFIFFKKIWFNNFFFKNFYLN